jgi:hypothetical protein
MVASGLFAARRSGVVARVAEPSSPNGAFVAGSGF